MAKTYYGMTKSELGRRAQAFGISVAEYLALLAEKKGVDEEGKRIPTQLEQVASAQGTLGSLGYPTRPRGTTATDPLAGLFDDIGGGGGGGYRPQTAEEAAEAAARTALYKAQTADIPLARELERRGMLATVGVQQAERAANPRRVFESIYAQSRLKPTEMAKGLQDKMNIPGFKKGKVVKGPVLALVGKNDDEYARLAPGSVVAPKPEGERPTPENAAKAITRQEGSGGAISAAKAAQMLEDGTAQGKPLTGKQRRFFQFVAHGGVPDRLERAQGGLDVWGEEYGLPQDVIDAIEKLRKSGTSTIMGATRGATGGTSLYDPLGGSTFTGEQADFLRGLNLRNYGKMSPTQRGAVSSMLSANRVAPEDYEESLRRQFMGFNPVQTGTRAKFAGTLGRR